MIKYLDYDGLSYLWSKIVDSIGGAVSPVIRDVDRLDTRMSVIELLSTISLDGGSIVIGTSADFINRTTAGDAKIPTVGAVADSADLVPTKNSNNFVISGGVYDAIPKMIQLTLDQYNALTEELKLNGSWYFIEEE